MMSDEEYPPADVRHLVRRVPDGDSSPARRNWTGNDESVRNYHGAVPLRENPLRLRLCWKNSKKESSHLIGVFDLNLRGLLEGGYVRLDSNSEDEIRLRFYHGYDNVIYVQANLKGPGLPVGIMP